MKLQKRFLRKVNGKKYYKFMINIPPKIIKKLGWRESDELKIKIEENNIKLEKEKTPQE